MTWSLAPLALLMLLSLGCNSAPPASERSPRPRQERAKRPANAKTITIMIPVRGRDRGQETLREQDIPPPSAPMIPARRDPTSGIDPNID